MANLYVGPYYDSETEIKLYNSSKKGWNSSGNNFQKKLVSGLDDSINIYINYVPAPTFPFFSKKIEFEKQKAKKILGINFNQLSYINIPILKSYILKKDFKNILKKYKPSNVIVYTLDSNIISSIKKYPEINLIAIVADLPKYSSLAKKNKFIEMYDKYKNSKINRSLNRVNKFILFSEYMKYPLNIKDFDYEVIEGIIDHNLLKKNYSNTTLQKGNRIKILYAGTLNYKFGILEFTEEFIKLNERKYELVICGSGEASEELKVISEKNENVTYYGFLPFDKVLELYDECDIFLNTRKNDGDYTKYSFPSKMMEYLTFLKPIICYKLDGIPDEYDKFFTYLDNKNLNEVLGEVNKYDKDECYNYLIKNKISSIQVSKIQKFFR